MLSRLVAGMHLSSSPCRWSNCRRQKPEPQSSADSVETDIVETDIVETGIVETGIVETGIVRRNSSPCVELRTDARPHTPGLTGTVSFIT